MKRIILLISSLFMTILLVGCQQNNMSKNNDKNEKAEQIEKAGGSILSKNIIEEKGVLTWMFREESVNPQDNGWRFLSDIDDQDYLDNPDNFVVWDFNRIAEIEPAIIALYDYPVGTDIQVVRENDKIRFYDHREAEWLELDDVE